MRHTQSTRLFKVNAAQDRTLVLRVSLRENDAGGNRTRRTAVRRSHLVRDWKSRSFLLRGARSRGCTLLAFFGVMPAAHIDSQTIRFMRPPRTWLVWMQGCLFRENGVDDGPGSFYRVSTNEQHGISMHSIAQQTLILGSGVNFMDCPQKRPKIGGSYQGYLQQSVDFHPYDLRPPAVLAYEFDAIFSLPLLGGWARWLATE
jgi:hypothetical protein